MKNLTFLFVTFLLVISLISCGTSNVTSDDLEGDWKLYKIKNSNSNNFQITNNEVIFTFKKNSTTSGSLEIYSETQQITEKGEYSISEDGYSLETIFLANSSYPESRYQLEASVGVLYLTGTYFGNGYLFVRK